MPVPGRVLWIQVTGMMMRGKNQNPQKIPRPKFNPPNIPFRISEPQKFICRITWLGYVETITNLQIVLNTQKNPYLNQATPKILDKIFQPKKTPKFKISHPKKPLIMIPVT